MIHARHVLLVLSASACTIEIPAIVEAGDEAGDMLGDDDELDASEGGESESAGPLLDMPDEPATPIPYCQIPADARDGLPVCDAPTPGDQLAPQLAWSWTGPRGETSIVTTPLVGNLDDDDGDGFVDLCDVPDVVVAAVDLPPRKTDPWPPGHLYVLAGDGSAARRIEHEIDAAINPAIGDLDGDGRMEIVALAASGANSPYEISTRRLVAFDGEGALLWTGEHQQAARGGGALAIADLEGDGLAEILAPEYVAEHDGALRWALDDPPLAYSMPIPADLEHDGELELLFGGTAYAPDGQLRFQIAPGQLQPNLGSAALANFDDDPWPEIYVQQAGHHGIAEHDGSVKAQCPIDETVGVGGFPIAIHDLDGDARAEIVFAHDERLYVLGVEGSQCSLRWSRKLDLVDARSSGTIFDLLDDGQPELIHADQSRLRIFSGEGGVVFELPRTARDEIANPIVADLDADGAADILVVSSEPLMTDIEPAAATPSLLVIENASDDFASARRIWHQHAYRSGISTELGKSTFSTPDPSTGFRTNTPLATSPACIPSSLGDSN